MIATLIVFFIGVCTSTKAEVMLQKKDCGPIVIDEIMGYLVTMFMIPWNFWIFLASFPVFRFFDIYKPHPARRIHIMRGGWGVMMDDFAAGVYSNLVLHLVVYITISAPQTAPV